MMGFITTAVACIVNVALAPPPQVEPVGGNTPIVVVVPIEGQIGVAIGEGESSERSVDARMLKSMLDDAARTRAATIVLAFDSHGGYLDERDRILDLLESYRAQRIELVAFVKEAMGAASTLALSCERIYVAPTAALGAASVDREHISKWTYAQLDDFDAAEGARIRSVLTRAGHSEEIATALVIRNTTLWWSPTSGYSATRAVADSVMLTDSSRVLALTANQMIELGIADSIAEDASDAARQAMASTSFEIRDLGRSARSISQQRQRLAADLDSDITEWYDAIKALDTLVKSLDRLCKDIDDRKKNPRGSGSGAIGSPPSLAELQRELKSTNRDYAGSRRTLERIVDKIQKIVTSDRAILAIDDLTICRAGRAADLMRDLPRSIDSSDDAREATRVIDRMLGSWSECSDRVMMRSSRVRR